MEENKMSNNKSRNIRVQVGITLVLLSLVLFVFTTFEFLMSVKLFFLGVFGVMFYSLLLFMFLFGIALLTKKKFMYSPKYIVLLFLAFFFFVCIVHIIFTTSSKPLNYSQYLNACYDAVYSPGGVFIGMFTYPVTKLLHDFAGIVIYGIALIISIYFILNYLDNYKQQKQVVEERPEYETFHFEKEEPKNLNLSSTERVDETEQILSKENKEDDKEVQRVKTEYMHYPLHPIIYSFYVAFKSYFTIARYAKHIGASIINITPGSFIDAFPRENVHD